MTDDTNLPAPLFGSGTVDINDAARFEAAMADTVDEGARGGDVSYMSFSGKKGGYKIGVDKRIPDPDEKFVVAPTLFTLGYLCWKGGKVVGRRMAAIGQPPITEPAADELGPFTNDKDGWSRARGLTMKSVDTGEQIEFTTNSKSGVAVVQQLQRDVFDLYQAGQPCVPVITLSEEEFEAKDNINMKPVFETVDYLSVDELNAIGNGELDLQERLGGGVADEPAPQPRRRSGRL